MTTAVPMASSTAAPARPGRTARRTLSGSHAKPSGVRATSGSSRATGRRASAERQHRHDEQRHDEREGSDPERTGDGEGDRTGDGDGVPGPPGTERGRERTREQAAPELAVGRHVDHRLARPEPRHPDQQGQPEQRHQRHGEPTDRQVRTGGEQPERGTGAGGLPAVAGRQRLDQPRQHHRRQHDDERRHPGEHPDERRRATTRHPATAPHDILRRGIVGPRQGRTDPVADTHPAQCARQPPTTSEQRRCATRLRTTITTKPPVGEREAGQATRRAGAGRQGARRGPGAAGRRARVT